MKSRTGELNPEWAEKRIRELADAVAQEIDLNKALTDLVDQQRIHISELNTRLLEAERQLREGRAK